MENLVHSDAYPPLVTIIIKRVAMESLLCARHCAKYFINITSLNSYRNPKGRNYCHHFIDEEMEV